MKKKLMLVTLVGILVLLAAGCGSSTSSSSGDDSAGSGPKSMSVSELKQELAAGALKDTVIVDLREPNLYQEGHIQGAILIPFADFEEKYSQLDKNKRIILVCHTGPMGEAAGQFLLAHGYKQVYNLDGGMAAWQG